MIKLYNLKQSIRTRVKRSNLMIASLMILLSFGMVSISQASSCPGSNVISNPTAFVWTYHPVTVDNPEAYYSGTMEVGEANFTFNNGGTLTTRAYRQQGGSYSIPGPTLHMTPGNKYVLSLHNTLPFETLSTSHNVYKDPNAVNIHTHGLHISGESPADDVTRVFEGGRGGDFVYDIPADHMGGTYWYHAHHHGATLLQVAGGMFGMIVIDDSNDGIPATVSGMEEKELLFGFVDPNVSGTGGDNLMSGTLSPTWTVNGIIGGNICMPTNTWQHWRVAIADRGAMLRDVEFGPDCEVKVLARDGVWRTVAPKDLASNTLMLTGASRADFAIRATADSWVKVNGNTVANIFVDGASDPSVHPYDLDGVSSWSAIRPNYLRDLRAETNVNFESVSMGARTVDGSKYDHHNANFTLPATQVQEWRLSGNVRHPFHLHVYHVQALEDDRDFEAGEYYDVVASQMDVRFDLNNATTTPYQGRTIMHCHILAHEDQGAMGWLDVQGGQAPPTFPADASAPAYGEYYVIGVTPQIPADPSALSASAISSAAIDLNWTDNSSDEDGFNIERSSDGINFSFLASVGAGVTSFNNNGLTASTTYYYRVSAYNVAGSSAATNVASATTQSPPQIPADPSALSATAISSSAIDLSWADNSSDEDGFNIEQSADGINFSFLATTGANATSYSDNGLNASTIYYYRVNAYNVAGNSGASNIANATTQAPPAVTELHVESISVTRNALNGNRFQGAATVIIHDNTGTPVSGATVDVNYSGPNSGSRSGTTNGSGEVSYTTNALKNPSGEWCFDVTGVSKSGDVYNPAANVVTSACESSGARKTNLDRPNSQAQLLGAFPNPFTNSTKIAIQLEESTDVTVEVYTIMGELIAVVANRNYSAGHHLIEWNTESVAGGTYFMYLRTSGKIVGRHKMMLMR